MNERNYRIFLILAFLVNLAFLALAVADIEVWESRYFVGLAIGWGAFLALAVLFGAFARPADHVREIVVERVASGRRPDLEFRVVERAAPAAAASAPPARAGGPFTFNGYTLHAREVELKGEDRRRTIYFFAKSKPRSGHPVAKPDGFHVGVNERTGLPFLKRGPGPEGEDLTPEAERRYRPQCAALTDDGGQCRNSARAGSKYCASHRGYQPPTAKGIVLRADTASKAAGRDTKPAFAGDGVDIVEKGAQCQALTASGGQCKNVVVEGSQYCATHKGYRAPTAAVVVAAKDTRPRVRKAEDTKLAVRRPARRR